LCAPMLDRLERLPDPQHDAVGVAFGLSAENAPDRFLVGLAVLSLLSDVSEDPQLKIGGPLRLFRRYDRVVSARVRCDHRGASTGGAGCPCQNSRPGWACSRPRNP
jgi:hypothetical protein